MELRARGKEHNEKRGDAREEHPDGSGFEERPLKPDLRGAALEGKSKDIGRKTRGQMTAKAWGLGSIPTGRDLRSIRPRRIRGALRLRQNQ